MNQKQIIKELENIVEMASFKIACEDGTQENYTVVEISDIETIIEKIKNKTLCH